MVPDWRHINSPGGKCGSPALRGKTWCYFHSPQRLPGSIVFELEGVAMAETSRSQGA